MTRGRIIVRYRYTWLLGAAAVVIGAAFAAEDDKGFRWLAPAEIEWQDNPEGPDFAFMVGDPTKEGFYVVRARFAPGVMSRPHYHPSDRHVTVISGTWWAGRGPNFDPNDTIPLGPGSYMLHPAGEIHFDGAKDVEAIVEIKGMGPAPTIPAGR
jgi:quercetin dioxygenase-like cupin family protein